MIGLSDLQHCLAPHQSTLRKIKFGSIHSASRTCIDLSDYTALETITFPGFHLTNISIGAAAELLAPRLAKLSLRFLLDSGGSKTIKDIAARTSWVREFIAVAVQRKAALRNVSFKIYDDRFPSEANEAASFVSTDLRSQINKISAEFKTHGITFTSKYENCYEDNRNVSQYMAWKDCE